MRRALVFSLSLIGLTLGLAARREAFSEERDRFRPEEIRIGRIDARGTPFEDLTEQLRQATGLTIDMDDRLAGRSVYLRLNNVSLQSVLEVALPSQGATGEWQAESGLRLSAIPSPWFGLAGGPSSATPTGGGRLLNFRTGDLKVQDLVDRLGLTYHVNLVCDHRIAPRPVRLELIQSSFAEGLAKLCALGGWSWVGNDEIVVLLPSPESQLLHLPSLAWRNWVFDRLAGSEVAQELAGDFRVPIQLSIGADKVSFAGQIRGKTLGEVVEDFCRQTGCAYAVFGRTLFVARSQECLLLEGDTKPPSLDVETELVNIPGDLWMRQRIQRIVTSALSLSPERMEEQVAQIRQIAGSAPLVKHTLTLESGSPAEIRLEPASPQEKDFILLSGRFHYLSQDYARVELSVGSERADEGSPVLNASLDAEALALKRPYLWCSELQYPDTERSSVVVFYLKFKPRLSPGETEAVYRPMVWHIPRGTDSRRDLTNEFYCTHFPGPWSEQFLPRPFFGRSDAPADEPSGDG